MPENPERFGTGGAYNSIVGAVLDSTVARAVPTARIHKITGTGTLTSMTPPWAGFSDIVILIPSAACAIALGGATNGFAKAVTLVANEALALVYHPIDDLWYPLCLPA